MIPRIVEPIPNRLFFLVSTLREGKVAEIQGHLRLKEECEFRTKLKSGKFLLHESKAPATDLSAH